jgi:hypothetical protein
LPEGDRAPVGYKQIPCHIIFDVKMDFTCKVHFVAGGHKVDPPSSLTYSSVMSCDSVHIAFLLAALNDLDIQAAGIGNTYINADVREPVYFTAGDEFGEINKAAGPDVRYCAKRKQDGFEYYAYTLIYIDNILVISHNTRTPV